MPLQEAKIALKKYFGYDSFRPMQAEVIQAIYDKKDALVLMPTGGGKSICFQIPAITMEGVCIVVSPLISLMKDQVEGLKANGVKAAFLNSSLTYNEQRIVEDDLFNGKINLCYVSPEKLVSGAFIPLLKRLKVNLFAIDEAHCISSWGHDFRPEYTKMRFLKQEFPQVPIIALTATADKVTRRDIIKQLHLPEPEIFIASFDRPNLSLTVLPGQKRLEQIIYFIKKRPNQAGIIYCLSRKSTENLAAKLQAKGINAAPYHARLSANERSQTQEDFINDRKLVICATVAFGMGIDKSNVRWVLHYNMPKNIEGYYQEIGRAGRDGLRADTVLFYSYADFKMLQDMLYNNESSQTEIKIAKLERMYQFATAQNCRRKILLSYFSEHLDGDCGNCDICKNPPTYVDGTIIAQKALSAIFRLKENVATGMLIDVLRGSGRKDIFQNGYQNIKTYGVGREYSIKEWRYYLEQLLNIGVIDIAHDDHNKVKLTPASRAVLFDGNKVRLVDASTAFKKKETAKKTKVKAVPVKVMLKEELFELLRQLRKRVSQQRGIPPYLIFSDASLEDMAVKKPGTENDMKIILGMSEKKLRLYGSEFLDAIQTFIFEKSQQGQKIKGSTYIVTYKMYREGNTVDEIAEKRGLNPLTIYSHLAYLYLKGENIDLNKYVSNEEIEQVATIAATLEEPYALKNVYEALEGKVEYNKIRLALAHYQKNVAVA